MYTIVLYTIYCGYIIIRYYILCFGGELMIYIYCDESCHLEYDDSDVMVLGGISCNRTQKNKFNEEIRNLKIKHGLSSWFEVKWTKVSHNKIEFYKELVDYFFLSDLSFRGVIAKNKKSLNHKKYNNGIYDTWYYKMYFLLLDAMITPIDEYKVFVDIKDTNGGPRVKKLREVLCNNIYDFKGDVIKDIKQVNSKDSEILQITDLFIGALSYKHRDLDGNSQGKTELIKYIEDKYSIDMNHMTSRNEKKFNLFIWAPRG